VAHVGSVNRWDIFWADLDPPVDSEQGGENRPVVIVSNDMFNRGFAVVTVVPLTTRRGSERKTYGFEVRIPAGRIDPEKGSIAMPQQIRTISKMRLRDRLGRLDDANLRYEIEEALLKHLDIAFEP